MKGMKLWVTTLLSYDEVGNATVLKSFVSPAKDSAVKKKEATKMEQIKRSTKPVKSSEEVIW